MDIKIDLAALYQAALNASEKAYAPYSNFRVGAALLLPDGTIKVGVHVENRSFGLTNCAERTAVFAAAAEGYRSFKAIAIATPDAQNPTGPCGACRQVLTEFAPPETVVVFGAKADSLIKTTLGELYPFDSLHELADK
ncbi:MAG: cytidine deaminase [Elusimicrobiota bacterium]|jgi:cytidine deaminase|nr:cytidine deaminase [Elusimicrobiota bacterium]